MVMQIVSGLKPFQIIVVGPVKTESVAIPEVGVAWAVVPVVTSLIHMGMDIAVQDSHGHVGAVEGCEARHRASIVDKAVKSEPILKTDS